MAQSLSKIYIHLIFHIKSTSPQIRENDLERLHNYIGKLVKTAGCTEIKAGGIGDHVHVLFILSKDVTISQIVEEIIGNQKQHHAKHSFAEEYRAFLQLYNVEYDEKFVFRD